VSAAGLPTIVTVLDDAVRQLREAGVPDPRRDAAALMAIVLGTDQGGVAVRKPDPLDADRATRFAALIDMRKHRMPLQYLTGHADFRGLDFAVNPAVLIPRPETEDLAQAVLDAGLRSDARIVDLGSGSGCIAIALAVVRPSWRIEAVDASADALAVVARNALRHGVSDRIGLVESDFAAPPASWRGVFDAVVSNPPYIGEAEWRGLAPEVRDHEPKRALVPGPTGNEAYAVIAPIAFTMLLPGGLLALELGWTSERSVRAAVAEAGFADIAVRPDIQGIPRVLTARR
jgi:release factor glutamine methyltransferase